MVTSSFEATEVRADTQCYVSVLVKDTDYDAEDEYVEGTTVNGGQPVHGKCSPSDGAVVDADGFFECARYVALPPSADGTYTFVTTATPAVDEDAHEGSFVYVEYRVDCEGHCAPPSAPPLPLPPPPVPPTCSYSATPAGGGNGTSATSTFVDPHAPMPPPPPDSGADAGDGSVSLGFELDATPETCLLYTSPSPRDS